VFFEIKAKKDGISIIKLSKVFIQF